MSMFQRLAIFMIGMVAGATFIVAVKGHDLDLLYLHIQKLNADNSQLQEELDSLKQDLFDRQKQSIRKIKKIEVEVAAPDEFTKLAISKRVKDWVRPLLNQELSYLEEEPRLVTRLVDERMILIDNQTYKIRVLSVYIGETLHMRVEALKQPGT
jgi:hypothetical protein